jgi:23S rRNA pseudouridine955/2504/2580 synthase
VTYDIVRYRGSPDEFFFTNLPLPSEPAATERACGRRPCRSPTPCVQLVATFERASNAPWGTAKQVK